METCSFIRRVFSANMSDTYFLRLELEQIITSVSMTSSLRSAVFIIIERNKDVTQSLHKMKFAGLCWPALVSIEGGKESVNDRAGTLAQILSFRRSSKWIIVAKILSGIHLTQCVPIWT